MAALQLHRPGDGIAVIRLDRPQVRNALDSASIEELCGALAQLGADPEVRVVVLSTTSTRALCAGADVGEQLDAAGGVARMEGFARLYAALEAFPSPTIAVCVGNCVGAGAELVAGCDLRVGADNLKLAWAGSRLGVPVGPARLVPLIGLARAKDLILTGRVLGMDEAAALGLLSRTATADDAEDAAIDMARDLAARPADGLRRLKQVFREDEGTTARVTRENERLVAFQRDGAGLPQGARGADAGSARP